MRHFVWAVLILSVATPVAIWFIQGGRDATGQRESATLSLSNRPSRFCPETAKVVAVKTATPTTVHFEGQTTVRQCEIISLPIDQLSEPIEYQIFVQIDRALAFRAVVTGPVRTLSMPIQLGDVTGDNTINEDDIRELERGLGQAELAAQLDIDGDKEVTILDYALVRLNQGAGVSRPDGKLWSVL